MSFFKGIEDVKAARDSVYLRAGRYLTHFDTLKAFKNRKDHNRIAFEMTIVSVLDDTKASADPSGAHRMGDKVSWVPTDNEAEQPRVKAAIRTITGVPEEEITEEFCAQLTSEAQPLRGLFIEWDAEVIRTKAGAPFTVRKAVRKWSKAEVEQKIPETILKSLKITTDAA